MKKILITALNWGLGHATRCIPVIHELLLNGKDVSIASDGDSLNLLKHEFPQLPFFELPSYNISYSRGSNMIFKMFSNLAHIRKAIDNEHRALKKIQSQCKFDMIISDNRYGMWHEGAWCIFITHQLNIRLPGYLKFLQGFVQDYNLEQVSRFNECWIPDFEGADNLSGELSHNCKLPPHSYYIGPLSRFNPDMIRDSKFINASLQEDPHPGMAWGHPLLIVLSGPEPQRTVFEEIILEQVKTISCPALIVRGLTKNYRHQQITEYVQVVSYLASRDLFKAFSKAELIISRSGYSTIMDLAACGKRAVLVPTPGQTEQEYLADNFLKKKIYYSTVQQKFNLGDAMEKSKSFTGLNIKNDGKLLSERIRNLPGQKILNLKE